MKKIHADYEGCQGYANCVMGADDYFDLDDDGVVVLLEDEVPVEDEARVNDAAQSCPVSVLWLESTS